ncbi:ATP-binding protein [Nucisporomicrobium flavum]|uniref:ATP-binding protein n=1 Tax=Nucisporomicrobium flavum TaxID=2785915 RepID=UPI001F1BA9FB|nr:ATP-binding protein [Nucisporomicrobium flavum]
MPSEVRHRVDGGLTYPVVRLTGVLDTGSAPAVRSALLDILGGQPEALVVDVRELSLDEPEAVTVLRDVARAGAEWPGAPLVVCAAGDARAWHGLGLPTWSTPEEAFTALGDPAPDHFLSTPLQPIVGAARRSRELITEACARWELRDLAGPACIVVTEMVNNVVAHANTDMVVLLGLHGGTMTVAVRDRSPDVPRYSGEPVPVTSYGGRGLLLIDSVASRWGCLPVSDGKVVWAALAGDEEPAGDLRGTGMAGRSRG